MLEKAKNLEKKNIVIILIFIVLAVFLVFATHYGTKTLSAVRAYIAAEGRWTKAQKQATNQLLEYAIYRQEEYYNKAQKHLRLHDGFKQARNTLLSENPDRSLAREGFNTAEINPKDIDLLIWLTVNFKSFDRFEEALSIWGSGNKKIARLDSLSRELHTAIQESRLSSRLRDQFISEIISIDQKLTRLENSFSESMAELARWIRSLIFWSVTGSGSILLIVGYLITSSYFREISYLNRRLSESESSTKKVLENSRDVIYELDINTGYYDYMSHYVEEMLGYSADRILKKGKQFILDLIHPDDLERLQKELEESDGKAVDDHFTRETEFRLRTKEGNYIWISNHRSLIKDDNGVPSKIVGSVRDISERKKHEVEMEKALLEKQTLLNEIHHRVKNNLAVISSLLELQKDEPVESLPSMIEDTQYRIQSIAKIHDKLYQSDNLSGIDIKEYIEDFSELIMKSYSFPGKNIEFKKDLDSFYLDITKAAPLGLIYNELLNNSFEHGFSESSEGTIAITLAKNNGEATLTVADNGKELPADFNMDEMSSLGMTLVKTLINQLNAHIQVTQDEWTKFTITFPVH